MLGLPGARSKQRLVGFTRVFAVCVHVCVRARVYAHKHACTHVGMCRSESEGSRQTLGSTLNDSLDVVTTPARYNRNSNTSTPEAASTAVMLPVFVGNGDGETPVSAKNRNDSKGSGRSPSTSSTVTHTTTPGDHVLLDGGDVGGSVSRKNDSNTKTHDSEAVLAGLRERLEAVEGKIATLQGQVLRVCGVGEEEDDDEDGLEVGDAAAVAELNARVDR